MQSSSSDNADSLFDRYLDAALEGDVRTPDEFMRDAGATDSGEAPWLERVYDLVRGDGRSTAAERERLPADDDVPREALGDYRLLKRLGRGGMGEVYLAEQESLGRLCAVKVVRSDLVESPTALERLKREARAAARLRHPGIVSVFELGHDDGLHFLAMELVPGRTLDEVYGDGVAPRDVLVYGAALARALHAAHEQGIVHRDVKPTNVIVDPQGRPRLLDFGLAKDLVAVAPTLTHSFVGSPAYSSPEQLRPGALIDARTDQYSLAVTLWEGFSGGLPFEADTMEELCRAVLNDPPPALGTRRPGLPRDLDVVLGKALEKDPADRYATAADLADDLEAVLELRPIRARPPGRVARGVRWARRHRLAASALCIALVAVLGAAGFVAWDRISTRRANRAEALGMVDDARAQLVLYEKRRPPFEQMKWQLRGVREKQNVRRLTPIERRSLETLERQVEETRQELDVQLEGILEQLAAAERLDRDVNGVHEARAHLFYLKWLEHRLDEDDARAGFYRQRSLASDRSGEWTRRLASRSPVSFRSTPPGAEVLLFRYRYQSDLFEDGERRLVPVPHGADPPPYRPGTLALRVVAGAGELRPDDVITHVDGRPFDGLEARAMEARAKVGSHAKAWRDGIAFDARIADGLVVRATATPLPVTASCRLGVTPLDTALDAGWYVAVYRLDGHESVRHPMHVDYLEDPYHKHGHADMHVSMLPAGSTPPGWVRVAADAYGNKNEFDFEIMECEVTCGEYLEFLRAAGPSDELVPREAGGNPWPRGGDGLELPEGVLADHPVGGITWAAASAYARWMNGRGDGYRYRLPRHVDFIRGSVGGDSRRMVFGDVFRSPWIKSRFAGPTATREPVRSYVRDESPFAVYDLAGGVAEWGRRKGVTDVDLLFGGGFEDSEARWFRLAAQRSISRGATRPSWGFRLVRRRMP